MEKYKWKLEFTLKCGKVIDGFIVCDHKTSDDVAKEILLLKRDTFFGMADTTEKHNIFVELGSVAALDISPYIL